jgi:hypothetical protein
MKMIIKGLAVYLDVTVCVILAVVSNAAAF